MQPLLDSFYGALRKLSAEELAALVAPDFTLRWQGSPAIAWAGDWRGVTGLLQFVETLGANVDVLGVEPVHTLHGPDCSVVVLEGHWRVRATGVEIRATAANVFTFAGDRILSYTVLNNTAAFADALAGVAPSQRVVPALRITDDERSKAFYVDGLGFRVEWEHRFEPGFPVFMSLAREGMRIYLSQHTGDCQVGGLVHFIVHDVAAWHREFSARGVQFAEAPNNDLGFMNMTIADPDGNQLRFMEPSARQD